MNNFLEQLVAEWYEFQGYFVRRNVRVGKRVRGGFSGELDVVAFNPDKKHLVHIEASSDAWSWQIREKTFARKFEIGRKYIQDVFTGFDLPKVEPIALLMMASPRSHPDTVGGGKVQTMAGILSEIRIGLPKSTQQLVHEQYVILRTLQFAKEYWTS